jgi:ABC transport system ATP-binding/permease protein
MRQVHCRGRDQDYGGTLLLVSHDRDFLDRLVTSVIAVEGSGLIQEYVGGYSDYMRQRPPRPAPRAVPKLAVKAAERVADRQANKLTWKEQRELDSLPAQIGALESEKAQLEAVLADRAFYTCLSQG